MSICFALLSINSAAQPLNFSSNEAIKLPAIGEPADQMLSPAEEQIIGINGLRRLYRDGAILNDPESAHYIQHIGNRITNTLGNNKHKFTFFIINDPAINAFAMPGGFIGVNAGLILASKNENELAGVLAHEIAHVTQRHIARRLADMKQSSLPMLGGIIASILVGMHGSGNSDLSQALLISSMAGNIQRQLNFSREHEIEADRIGFDLLYRSGFDPEGMSDFFKTLQRHRMSANDDQFEFLRTHPMDKTRITEARSRADRLPGQANPDSQAYHLTRARLQALVSKDIFRLVQQLNIDPKKTSDTVTNLDRYALSQALEINGDNLEAAKLLKSIENTHHDSPSFKLALARSLQNSGNTEESVTILDRLHKLYPDHYPTTFYYGQALKNAQQYEKGSQILETYLQTNTPHTIEIYRLLAELYSKTGKPVDSKEKLAEFYFRGGNFNAAIQQLRDALNEKDIDYIKRSQIEQFLKAVLTASKDQ